MAAGLAGRTTAALALTVAVLSGCSEEQPANDSLPSATAETTSSEALPPLGPADFPVPDEARQKTPDGALEFTRYYVQLIGYVANGDLNTDPLVELSRGCSLCTQIVDSFAEDRGAGYTYSDVAVTFEPYGPGVISGDQAEVGFVFTQGPVTVIDGNGQTVSSRSVEATGDLQSGALLLWLDETRSWAVTSLTLG